MATTIWQAFQEFSSNLEITNYQTGLVSDRRKNVVETLKRRLSLLPEESKLIGSYDRHTLIRYLSEADVDVMVILHYGNNQAWYTHEGTIKALDCFREILDTAYPNTHKRRDRNCITMNFLEFRLDVVPAYSWEGGYYKIPDSIRQEWVPTNPLAFSNAITTVNKNMGGSFVPLIKMVKAWNRDVGWPIRSFHLECMMYNRYQIYNEGYTYPSMLKFFFEDLPAYLTGASYDPIMHDRVDTYLDNYAQKTQREIAIEKANAAARAVAEAYAYQEEYPSIAIKQWKSLMGEFFPSYG